MPRYQEFEHTADIGVEIYGNTVEELFCNAGYALFDTIVDVTRVTPKIARAVRISADDIETLFIDWLRELLYLFSVHQEVYAEFDMQFLELASETPTDARPLSLEALVKGEPLDLAKHDFRTELKAVTYHQFTLINENQRWTARVIFDV